MHPREVDEHFAHGTVTNYWGGSSNATTHLLDGCTTAACCGWRAGEPASASTRRTSTRRCRSIGRAVRARIDALVDVVVGIYAPLPAPSLATWSAGCATRCRSGAAS